MTVDTDTPPNPDPAATPPPPPKPPPPTTCLPPSPLPIAPLLRPPNRLPTLNLPNPHPKHFSSTSLTSIPILSASPLHSSSLIFTYSPAILASLSSSTSSSACCFSIRRSCRLRQALAVLLGKCKRCSSDQGRCEAREVRRRESSWGVQEVVGLW